MQSYTLVRSRRRTIAIHVHEGHVEVRAPMRVALRDIDAFVKEKSQWIAARLDALHEIRAGMCCIDDGCEVTVMGESLTVCWQLTGRAGVRREGNRLLLCGKALDAAAARRLFLRWLMAEARAVLLPMAEQRIEGMGLSARLDGFTLRYTRSVWGRCSARGNILFNPLILLAPLRVIDYLVVHEACHLRHMNHAPVFWSSVASQCEDWQQSRHWLREHGHRLQVR